MLVRVAFHLDAKVFGLDDLTDSGFDFLDFVDIAQQLWATAKVFTFKLHLSFLPELRIMRKAGAEAAA